jgi:hypothetical protein
MLQTIFGCEGDELLCSGDLLIPWPIINIANADGWSSGLWGSYRQLLLSMTIWKSL